MICGRLRETSSQPYLLALLLAFALASGAAAQPGAQIEGWFELRPVPDGKTPFAVQGWVVSPCGGSELTLLVDGRSYWRGPTISAWPGVAERFPDHPGSDRAGFWAQVDPAHFAPGEHRLELAVADADCGLERTFAAVTFPVAAPTSAGLAWPLLVLLLGGLPALLGIALARVTPRSQKIAALEPGIALLALTLAAVIVAARHLGTSALEIPSGLFASLANWDGAAYLHLATAGYGGEAGGYAYFPLYPLALRLISVVPLPLPLLASLLNAVLLVLAVRVLRRLYPGEDRGILLLAALPFAFFFVAVYTEVLFLLLAASFLLALRRGAVGKALVFGLLAGLTRVTAVALIFLALDFARARQWRRAAVAAAAPLAGLGLWMGYLWSTTGDPLKFLHVQSEFGRSSQFHPGGLLDALTAVFASGQPQSYWELAFLLLVLAGAAALVAEGRWSEGGYSAAVVLMPLVTLRLTSLNRYALLAFPVYLLLGGRLRNRHLFRLALALEIAVLCFHAGRFGLHQWVG